MRRAHSSSRLSTAYFGGGAAGAFEKQLLGGEVALHVAMEIQMIARQVGEDRGVEVEAVHAAQRQGVGGDFHGDVRAAGASPTPRTGAADRAIPEWC